MCRIVNPAHLAANSNNVHGEEDAVNTDKTHPEVNLAEGLIHEATEHFGEPIVQAAKSRKQRRDRHHQVEMGDDEVSILKLNVRGRRAEEDSAQTAADEERHEADR